MDLDVLNTLAAYKGPISSGLLIVCISKLFLEFRSILRKFMSMHEASIKECSDNNEKMRETVAESLSKLIDVLKANHKTDP